MISPSPELILQCVAAAYGTTPALLRSNNRHKATTNARAMFSYLCSELTRLSQPTMARILGGKDHTTILAGRNRVRRDLPNNLALQHIAAQIRAAIEAGGNEEVRAEIAPQVSEEVQRLRAQVAYATRLLSETKTDLARLEGAVRMAR